MYTQYSYSIWFPSFLHYAYIYMYMHNMNSNDHSNKVTKKVSSRGNAITMVASTMGNDTIVIHIMHIPLSLSLSIYI